MTTLATLGHGFAFEMELVVRIFYPYEKIRVTDTSAPHTADEKRIITEVSILEGGKTRLSVQVTIDGKTLFACEDRPAEEDTERGLGLLLFKLLRQKTGIEPVWGLLTGIRPVRLCGKWRGQGMSDAEILKRMTQDYLVAEEKVRLCLEILETQRKTLAQSTQDTFSLYVSIPFCPTRCRYCTFVSHAIDRAEKLVPDYMGLLPKELRRIGEHVRAKKLRPIAVYIGGGTPTVLSAEQLRVLMGQIQENFDIANLLEYTVEAGRADTLTPEKLSVIKAMGADRISVNPQSMTPRVLEAIGRHHAPEDVERGFYMAREAGFDWINMDIIAGLPEETPESFAASLDKITALSPENITVHALAVKRSSEMRATGEGPGMNLQAAEMQCYATEQMKKAGYKPYYLYRQKPAIDNLENTGYAKPGYEAAYNIYSMDDAHHILAAGAGAVGKLMNGEGKIRRVFNHKYPYEYIARFDEILARKGEILSL